MNDIETKNINMRLGKKCFYILYWFKFKLDIMETNIYGGRDDFEKQVCQVILPIIYIQLVLANLI